ncbi:hypothetical protein [Paramuribaculum intestinale]|nr:hypothetical protein [Paramuribaculum intestinale]
MIRRIMTAICCMAVAVAASAIDFNPEELYRRGTLPWWGVRASASVAFPLHVKYARIPLASGAIGPDISVGGLYHMPIRERWYLEPNVEVYYNHLKTTGSIKPEPAGVGITEATLGTIGMRVPIYFGWSHTWRGRRSFRVFAGPQFDFRFYTHFSCDGPTKIFQGTTARPLYGDYGTDLDVRAGLGYMWGHYYVGASFSYGIVRLTKSDFGVKRGRLISATVGYDF